MASRDISTVDGVRYRRRILLTEFVAATAAVPGKEKDHEGMDKGQKHPKKKHACVETGFRRAGVVQAWVPLLNRGEQGETGEG